MKFFFKNPSCFKQLYSQSKLDIVSYLKSIFIETDKGLLSEFGWLFLINDTSNFLDYVYGKQKWDENDLQKAKNLFQTREEFINRKKTKYFKIIIPEKIIVYQEYLPKILSNVSIADKRPSVMLSENIDCVFYLGEYLKDLKSYGRLYFRSDTHPNWLGSYFIYLFLIDMFNEMNFNLGNVISLGDLKPSIAKYQGDLYSQTNLAMLEELHTVWKKYNLNDAMSYDIKYDIPENLINFSLLPTSSFYQKFDGHRPVLVYENNDKSLPKCVVFRDSTADKIIELLAHHFSRIVFVWKEGNLFEEIIDKEQPDVVLHIMAERFVSDYPTKKVPYVTQEVFKKIYEKV